MMKSKTNEVSGDYSMSATRRMQAPGNIRSGFQTVGSRSSLANDIEINMSRERQDKESLPKAVVCLVVKNGKVLAVSRGDDVSNLNMPGGSVEPGENPEDAAVRELWEETGIKAKEIYPIFSKVKGGRIVTTFRVPTFTGTLKNSSEGYASWEDYKTLLDGQYGDYLKDVLNSMKTIKLVDK